MLSLAGLAYAVLSSAVIPALPSFQHDLHTTETGAAWLLTGFLVSASVGTSIIGRLGDIYGKERLLLWTLIVLAFGTVLAAALRIAPDADRRTRDSGRRAAGSFRSRSRSRATSSRP